MAVPRSTITTLCDLAFNAPFTNPHHAPLCKQADVTYSQEALAILGQLSAALEEGKAQRLVQLTPHVVVLSRNFYDTKLKSILCRWALTWLHAHGITFKSYHSSLSSMQPEVVTHIALVLHGVVLGHRGR